MTPTRLSVAADTTRTRRARTIQFVTLGRHALRPPACRASVTTSVRARPSVPRLGGRGHGGGLGAGADAELDEHPAHVVLDRLGREKQPRGDLAVRVTAPQPGQDLGLPRGQLGERPRARSSCAGTAAPFRAGSPRPVAQGHRSDLTAMAWAARAAATASLVESATSARASHACAASRGAPVRP